MKKKLLSQCIKHKLVPKGLELTLQPTTDDLHQEFIDKWYSSLKEFTLTLMSQIVTFSTKPLKKMNSKIDKADSILKTNL